MAKGVRLDENAEIYKQREKQSEKQKLKDMSLGKKVEYIWEYYRIHGLIIGLVIALVIYLIYVALNPAPISVFEAAIIDSPMVEETWTEFGDEFSDHLGIDPEKQVITLNTNYAFGSSIDYSVNMRQVLMARISANEIDVIIAPESEFISYAKNGYFKDLAEQIPTDIYSKITDQLFLSDTVVEGYEITPEDEEVNAYGIYINDTTFFQENSYSEDPYILGIMGNSDHTENTLEFIRYLLEQ